MMVPLVSATEDKGPARNLKIHIYFLMQKKKKNHPAQDVNNAKAEKPCSKDITMQQIFWAKIYLFGNTNKLKIIFFIAPISK